MVRRIGLIDLGTNSLRAFIFDCRRGEKPLLLGRFKEMVRLGDNVFSTGVIGPQALKRTIAAFGTVRSLFDSLQVTEVLAVGTSALRAARNRRRLITAVRNRYGFRLRPLSHRDEARLIGQGVIGNEPAIKGNTVIVDIGGGSVEIIFCRGRRILEARSFEMGAAAVQQRYLKSTPPRSGASDLLRHAVRRNLRTLRIKPGVSIQRAFASSGSLRTIAKGIAKRPDAAVINAPQLAEFIAHLAGATRKQIGVNKQIERKRIDLVLGAAIVLDEILAYFRIDRIQTTPYALKDGLLLDMRTRAGNSRKANRSK